MIISQVAGLQKIEGNREACLGELQHTVAGMDDESRRGGFSELLLEGKNPSRIPCRWIS